MIFKSNSGEVYGEQALTWAMIALSGFLYFAAFQTSAPQVTVESKPADAVVVTVPQERLS